MSDIEKHREAQRDLYGAPLNELLGRCTLVLQISQAKLAAMLGISAPMLSQLMGGRRIKIGNPTAAYRLQVLLETVEDVVDGTLSISQATERVKAATPGSTQLATTRRTAITERAREIQTLFRRQASAADFLAAADQIDQLFPEIAELLRVYGAGREDDATDHLGQGD